MAIDTRPAEGALERLHTSTVLFEELTLAARTAAYALKETEAIVTDELREQKVPATLIPKLIWKDHRVIARGQAEAEAFSNLTGLNARREADKVIIMWHQSVMKDRM